MPVIAILEILIAVIAWGASFIATKVVLREVSPATVVWLRFSIGVVILGIGMLKRKEFALPMRKDLGYFSLLGFLGITFHQWLQSNGLVTAQASTTAWIIATTPIFIALLGRWVLKERLTCLQVVGILLAAAGVLLVVSQGDCSKISTGKFGNQGDLLVMISALNWAVFSILSRRGLREHPATRMMFYVMAFGWLFSSILLFSGPGIGEIQQLTWNGWLGMIFLGVFCSGLAYIFWYDGLKALPASQVGAFLYVEPFITVLVAAIVLGEPLLLSVLGGGVCILSGVWLAQARRK